MRVDPLLRILCKTARVTRSFVCAYLLEMFSKGAHPNGEELIAMKCTMRAFLKSTQTLELEIRKGSHSEETLIKLTEEFKAIYDLYFSESVLRRLVKSQSTLNAYGASLKFEEIRDQIFSESYQNKLENYLGRQNSNYFRKQNALVMSFEKK